MTITNNLAANDMLLRAATRKPGAIVGPIAKLLGVISSVCFDFVYKITPVASLGITIILFTIIIKALLFPLSLKQQKSMMKTQAIQPKIKALQDKYKDNKDPEVQQKMSAEMSALYRENKVNPFSGCLPLLIQMPILFALYYVIQQPEAYITQIGHIVSSINGLREVLIGIYQGLGNGNIPMDQIQHLIPILEAQKVYGVDLATVEGMTTAINSISDNNFQTFVNTFFANNSALTQVNGLLSTKNEIYNFFFLNLIEAPGLKFPGILVPVITWVTTFFQYKVSMSLQAQNTSGNDMMAQQQKTMMLIFPFMMAFMTINLPSGLGLYWNISNLIQIGQQLVLNKVLKRNDDEEKPDVYTTKLEKKDKASNPKK
jgi:YidC/Oxa1 family membrane protein insertase